MSIDLIEAAWTDPILRSELLESEMAEIPEHPAGTVTSPAVSPINSEVSPDSAYDSLDFSCVSEYWVSAYSKHVCCF